MIQLLALYKETYILLLLAAVMLPLIGLHLAPRRESVKSLMLTQVAVFGVLMGILIEHQLSWVSGKVWPLIIGLIFTFTGAGLMQNKLKQVGESYYLVFFIFYMAASSWLLSAFPGLEAHQSQAFFGDIVTIYGVELWVTVATFALSLIVYLLNFKSFLKESFEMEVFGLSHSESGHKLSFKILTLVVITTSIYTLGMLFTLGLLFIGPTLLGPTSKSFKSFLVFLTFGSIICVLGGFSLALSFQDMTSVPTVIIILTLYHAVPSFWQLTRKWLA